MEEKHVQDVRSFHGLRSFHVNAAGINRACRANYDMGGGFRGADALRARSRRRKHPGRGRLSCPAPFQMVVGARGTSGPL